MRTIILTVSILLVLAAPAPAATRKVSGDEPTPQAAVDASTLGDRILIQEDWTGRLVIDGKSGIAVQGKKHALIDRDSQDNALVIRNCSDVTVTGLHFVNTADHGVTVQDSADVTITNCEIGNTGGNAVASGSAQRITVEKTRFDDSGLDAINLDVALTGTPPTDCVIAKNEVVRCDDDGIHVLEEPRPRDRRPGGQR